MLWEQRILNHIILDLRDNFRATPEFKYPRMAKALVRRLVSRYQDARGITRVLEPEIGIALGSLERAAAIALFTLIS